MLSKKKQKALIVLGIACVVILCLTLIVVTAGYFAIPLFVAMFLVIVGMIFKWAVEWIIINFSKLKVGEKTQIVKEKLKIDKGVELVKDSIRTLREKDDKDEF